jgi:transcriptional regulator with XRE-family HTH domain
VLLLREKPLEGADLIGHIRRAVQLQLSGLSLNELAKRCGVSAPQLSRFVRGERSLTLDSADRLFRFLGLKVVGPDHAGDAAEAAPPKRGRGKARGQ